MSSVISAPYALIAPTVAALKALTAAQRVANYCLFIPTLGSWVYYSSTSTATANDTTIIQPTDGLGRWIVSNQSAAPSGGGGGITRQPGLEPAAATLTDLQRAVNQVLSTLTAAGVTAAIIHTRNYDAANPTNDLINLLGTNNGTVAFANPHPAKITNSASGIMSGTVVMLTDRANDDFYTSEIANSWVMIDFGGTRTISLNGLGLKSRSSSATHLPANLIIEGGNDGTSFTLIYNWTSIGFTAINQDRFSPTFATSPTFRYIRIRQSGLNSSGANFFTIGELYLYGISSAM